MIFLIFMQSRRKNILYHPPHLIPFLYCVISIHL